MVRIVSANKSLLAGTVICPITSLIVIPVWLTDSQEPFSSYNQSGIYRSLLGHLSEGVEVGDTPGEDVESIASWEDVNEREERDGEEEEDEIPDNQGGDELPVDWLELQGEM